MGRKAIIIGAGPAGLTAAFELLKRTDILPIILEKSDMIGGISRTTDYKGNRLDMGPHRFFSKSDRVMNWWLNILPMDETTDAEATLGYHNSHRKLPINGNKPDPTRSKDSNLRMLVIRRLTRIYFLRKFFSYPLQLSIDTLRTLGFARTLKIIVSFLRARISPRLPEVTLEDFMINKFGLNLYQLFFKDYTEKVWGIAPSGIAAEWGAQRIKGVSLGKAFAEGLKHIWRTKHPALDIPQKHTETSLIEHFLYPKLGPGSLWEEVARQVCEMGGEIHLNQHVQGFSIGPSRVSQVITTSTALEEKRNWTGDLFFSTMPVQELIAGFGDQAPAEVQRIAAGLQYRDFINVGILLTKLSSREGKELELTDNWLYIQDRDVKVGRIMIYNNWGPAMVKDQHKIWIGMEYFCNKTDEIWSQSDDALQQLAITELEKIGLAKAPDVLDSTVCRMEKTYPAYFGTYNEFGKLKQYCNQFSNLFLIGRNGMHKYNNADHSMLTAMVAVDNIIGGVRSKDNLWSINTEQEYHEEIKNNRPAKTHFKLIKKAKPAIN